VVVPSKLACDSTGAALQAVSWAVTDTPGVPLSEGRKDFLVTCQLSNYEAYYGRWHLSSDGTLKVAPWNDQGTEFPDKGSEGFSYVWEQGEPFMGQVVRFLTTLFVALNCDKGEAVAPPRLIKAVKGKRPGMPVRNFMRPAMIGMDLKPSGFATHGERAAVSSHLRRGHMKWVRFGEGRKERKRVWIRHTMVHAKQKSEQPS
jgi:hypothetical protein